MNSTESIPRNVLDMLDARISSKRSELDFVFADQLPDSFTPPDEIVQGVLTSGAGSVLYGDSNSGKTFAAIDMCCSIARGTPWLGRRTEQGLVIYLATEAPASIISRLQAYQAHYKVRVPDFAIVKNPIDLFDSDHDSNLLIQFIREIERSRGKKARMIVGDTLARLSAGANENSSDMSIVVDRFDKIRAGTGSHFMLIHHSGKNAAAGMRGWSGVRAAIDTEIEVTDSLTGKCCEITKQRDLPTKGERIGFTLQVVDIGYSKWGDPMTSCIVNSADAPVKETGKRTSEVGGAIVEFLLHRGTGIKKSEIPKHFEGRYTKGAVYRQISTLKDLGQLVEVAGVIALGYKGAN